MYRWDNEADHSTKLKAGSDRDLCAGATLQLKPGIYASYEWQDQSEGSGFIVSDTGLYWVKVKDANMETRFLLICKSIIVGES